MKPCPPAILVVISSKFMCAPFLREYLEAEPASQRLIHLLHCDRGRPADPAEDVVAAHHLDLVDLDLALREQSRSGRGCEGDAKQCLAADDARHRAGGDRRMAFVEEIGLNDQKRTRLAGKIFRIR